MLLGHPRPEICNMQDVWVTLLALMLTLGLATLSWEFCEKHFVAKAQRVRYDEPSPVTLLPRRLISGVAGFVSFRATRQV
jgi:peptidoglycan/LPS O-acetylase OafA/YrhL